MKKNYYIDETYNHLKPYDLWKQLQSNEWLSITVSPNYEYAFQLIRIALHENHEVYDAEGDTIEIDR